MSLLWLHRSVEWTIKPHDAVRLTTPAAFILAAFIGDQLIRLILLCFAAIPVVATLVAYVIFMFRDPDRLQSEEYRIRQRALQILYKKGGSTEIVDVAKQVTRIEASPRRPVDGENE
jgi:hypothetical protein